MAMAVDSRQQSQLNGMSYDPLRYPQPHFTNPWVSAAGPSQQQLYQTSIAPNVSTGLENHASSQAQAMPRPTSIAIPYHGLPCLSTIIRISLSSQPPRNSFSDALDASRGMVSLSQSDITPRNIYGTQGSSRSSTDSYGFPSTHSAHSSISGASYNGTNYYGGEGSVTDYSSASESVDLTHSRTLPRPSALMGANIPPAPQSMMGQFSSKVSSSSQKKHKCKICDKRFTRPSSLQTHMYSHTGEKPFACEVDGCGRHFSVVSNLRRHRKVHKGEAQDHPSPDDA
ncbi:uncharacterized protein N0V89_011850 [Didymosphaeria variabile]|uniref:C2H2-type domain-containing protein n=1 Tax=Didymosphaeria variabile TaxID=1932322 RepID=A0A9W8XBX9_9PLEO|nr:uncharacterized protein N0V89_011850 [Didymosphaeria variabile]KAJ4345715.1 hypothetical protein N0V89_011850 [Didymosphaeria variabile]